MRRKESGTSRVSANLFSKSEGAGGIVGEAQRLFEHSETCSGGTLQTAPGCKESWRNFELTLRRAVETHPPDAKVRLGFAAARDRLRRFDLAHRAYAEAIRLLGSRVAILNNQAYFYTCAAILACARKLVRGVCE